MTTCGLSVELVVMQDSGARRFFEKVGLPQNEKVVSIPVPKD
jgi:hypothetical protein